MRSRGAYYVLTGNRNSGKTLICSDLVAEARARDLDVAGILTGLAGPGLQAPRQVIAIRSGATRLFEEFPGLGADLVESHLAADEKVFAWASDVLSSATPCDLLVIDELGSLEIEGGQGFASAVSLLRKGDFGAALVVCRPNLVKALEESVGAEPAAVYEAEAETSEQLPDLILAEMFD